MKTSSLVSAVCGVILRVACVAIVVLLVYKGSTLCYDYGYRIFTEPAISGGEGRAVSVTIPVDMSAKEMGELFLKKGLIRDSNLFVLQYYLSEFRKDIKPGTYELTTAMTVEEIMEVMATPQKEDEA